MKVTTYGIGGYDPTLPNNNIVDERDDGQPDPADDQPTTVPVTVDPDALDALTAQAATATTTAKQLKVIQALLALLNPN